MTRSAAEVTRSDTAPPPSAPANHRRTAPHLTFRPDIEGMRAVAVLLVVLSHVGLGTFAGGYVGVDVFFVISGFLITSLLLKELAGTGSISIRRFYARRITRLLPASTLVIVATLVAAWLWLPPIRLKELAVDAITSALYGVNYRLAVQGTDYWAAEGGPSPLQHYWSLAVEEQFYLVWPVLLLVSSLAWRRRSISVGSVSAALVLLGLVSFAASVLQTPQLVSWAYFGSHTRAWELALGALVAVGAGALARAPALLAAAATWVGLAAVVWSAVSYDDTTPFPGSAAAVPVLGTALVLAGGCAGPRGGAQALLRFAPLQVIGKLSYGWYLWHWPVLIIGPAALGRTASLKLNLALAAGALLLAAVSYLLVENPVRHHRRLRRLPGRALALGAGLSASAVIVALLAPVLAPTTSGRGSAVDTAAVVNGAAEPADALEELVADGATVRNVPGNLEPALPDAEDDIVATAADDCHLNFTEVTTPDSCVYGDPAGDTTVVLFGDSHAAQWFPALAETAEREGWRLLPMTKSACHASNVELWNGRIERRYDECMDWRETSFGKIRELGPDIVVMSSIDSGSSDLDGEHTDPDQVWADGWVESFRQVAGPQTELMLLLDTPRPGIHVPECLSEHLSDATACGFPVFDASREPDRRAQVADQVAASGVTVVDPFPWFCTEEICPAVVGNLLVYRDTNHMSTSYSTVLGTLLRERLSGQAG